MMSMEEEKEVTGGVVVEGDVYEDALTAEEQRRVADRAAVLLAPRWEAALKDAGVRSVEFTKGWQQALIIESLWMAFRLEGEAAKFRVMRVVGKPGGTVMRTDVQAYKEVKE